MNSRRKIDTYICIWWDSLYALIPSSYFARVLYMHAKVQRSGIKRRRWIFFYTSLDEIALALFHNKRPSAWIDCLSPPWAQQTGKRPKEKYNPVRNELLSRSNFFDGHISSGVARPAITKTKPSCARAVRKIDRSYLFFHRLSNFTMHLPLFT